MSDLLTSTKNNFFQNLLKVAVSRGIIHTTQKEILLENLLSWALIIIQRGIQGGLELIKGWTKA